jgi:hypothetical protein
MHLESLSAKAHASGNRIDLAWKFPAGKESLGARVVRREGTYPTTPEDGVVVAQGAGLTSAIDTGLKAETVYYYALISYGDPPVDPPIYDIDRHNRVAALATSSYDYAGQMHALLPGVYHRYDTKLSDDPALSVADRSRGQLRRFLDLPGGQIDLLHSLARAALDLYDIERVDGALLPLLAQWIGWRTDNLLEVETQRNELRHAPHLYRTVGLVPTIEATTKRITSWESRSKEFVHNVFRSNNPERLNLWIQKRSGGAWAPEEMLSLDFAYEGRATAAREAGGALWLLYHTFNKGRWQIWYKSHDAAGWTPSRPLPQSAAMNKYPAVVLAGGAPLAFWAALDDTTHRWGLNSSLWDGARWSAAQPVPVAAAEARQPSAFVDGAGRVWIFWLERIGSRQQLRYSRRDGTVWGAPVTFPPDVGVDARVEADPCVVFDPASTRIWVFWSRDVTIAADQTRREIAYRVKRDANFDAANWSRVRTLPKPASADYHDRQPAARIDASAVELFWSSNRGTKGYGIWRSALTNEATNKWAAAAQVTAGTYTQRDPLPVAADADLWLLFRSNRSISYQSEVYKATQWVDFRYAGSTSVDTRHADKLALRGEFEDFQTYTYDTGTDGERDDSNWYARDTVGVYLATDTLDAARVQAATERLRNVLPEFMPITDRAVFFARADRHDDYVYTYGVPGADPPQFITETWSDALTTVAEEMALGPGEDFSDALE